MKSSMRSLLLASSALLTSTSAFTFVSQTFVANFDNLNTTTTSSQTKSAYEPLPPVGLYNQLHWIGFSVDSPPNDPSLFPNGDEDENYIGIPPRSGANYASAPVVKDFFLPTMSSNYGGSSVVFFDLDYFYWGCSTPGQEEGMKDVPIPGWCSLEIHGYPPNSNVPTAKAVSFFFPTEHTTSKPLIYAGLPTAFKAMSRVEFKVDADTPMPKLYLDSVQYKVYNVTDIRGGLSEVIHQQTAPAGEKWKGGGQGVLKTDGF